ncbi:MAG TPA: multiheme c-type cytochrome [bacterium]|nr:multiheme c-type cytochrome [bacterium]
MRKVRLLLPFTVALLLGMAAWAVTETGGGLGSLAGKVIKVERGVAEVEKSCIECHLRETPAIVMDWKNSMHGRANVTCGDCHRAAKQDPDAFQCEGLRGKNIFISAIPTPRDCSRCHPVEAEQFGRSDHAVGYDSVKKLESMSIVWEGKGSRAAEASGCVQCHGGIVEFKDGRPGGLHYPQEGVGRINPDGSQGNCVVCHTRHRFNLVEARKAETCGACHIGPDHPQIEIWEESKHGKRYAADGDQWTWDSAPDAWEPGDYSAPTCAVCHMSGIGELTTTHNISERLSWQAERPLTIRTDNWEQERAKMKSVCANCHGPSWIDGFYAQYDAVIALYNEQYYQPAKKMMDELYAAGKITKDNPWDDEIEIVLYYLWHHEGRRARMGTAMMGQDYAHWHGFFELAQDLDKLTKMYNELMGK